MKRRSFLAGLLAIPVMAKAIEIPENGRSKCLSVHRGSVGPEMTATEVQQRWAAYWATYNKRWPRINDGYIRVRVIA